jgi:hypothetical protein
LRIGKPGKEKRLERQARFPDNMVGDLSGHIKKGGTNACRDKYTKEAG